MEPGRVAGGGAGPAGAIWRALVRWSIVCAFLFRAYLSLADARTVASGGLVSVPFSTVSIGGDSIVWPVTWGLLALVTAVALALHVNIGWLLGTAVAIAYVVTGISDSTTMTDVFRVDAGRAVASVIVGLAVPLAVLGGLFALRESYVPYSRRLAPGRVRIHEVTHSSLERWRRRY